MHDGKVYDMVIGEVERQLIGEALRYNGGVKVRTADFLGINRNTLNKKVKDLKIVAKD
jgi:Nif-specific regulatory protein